jgi:adenylylsulfate kinase
MRENPKGFAVWITGLPGSGKSVLSGALERRLSERGVQSAVLESDALRKTFSTESRYDAQDREYFYGSIAFIGKVLTDHGISVIFDATANKRAYRDRARREILQFLEVYVDSPLEVCMQRDPKGIYRKALSGEASHVPGIQEEYEAPLKPDAVVHGDRENSEDASRRIVEVLEMRGWLAARKIGG